MAESKSITGYRFLDKDPVIDLYRAAAEMSEMTTQQIAVRANVSPSTLLAWDKGDVKKPQHATLRSAMEACGYHEEFVNGSHVLRMDYRVKQLRRRHKR